jgi:hypothetical protein
MWCKWKQVKSTFRNILDLYEYRSKIVPKLIRKITSIKDRDYDWNSYQLRMLAKRVELKTWNKVRKQIIVGVIVRLFNARDIQDT